MKFQTRLLLIIVPMVILAVLTMGLWNFFDTREGIYRQTYGYMTLVLEEAVKNDLPTDVERPD